MRLKKKWGKLDFLVHAIGFSNKEELRGKYLDTSLENFKQTMHISCYSFTEACKYAENLMTNGGSILTLTYNGSEQVMPHYNVMGVAKAALEASEAASQAAVSACDTFALTEEFQEPRIIYQANDFLGYFCTSKLRIDRLHFEAFRKHLFNINIPPTVLRFLR